MLGLGLSLPELGGRAHGPDTASIALIARMTAAPDSARRGQIDALVRALKIAGIWPKLAALYLTAAHDAQAARLNWVSGSHDLTEHGALTFTADRGYTGDGSTGYLDSGWSPDMAGQDNLAIGGWLLTNIAGAGMVGAGSATTLFVNPRNSVDQMNGRINSSASGLISGQSDSRGLSMVDRSAGTTTLYYRDGVSIGGNDNSSATPGSASLRFLNNGASSFATHQIAAGVIAASMSAGEHVALHAALRSYLSAVAAV